MKLPMELGGNWQLIPRHCIKEWDFLVWDSQAESSGGQLQTPLPHAAAPRSGRQAEER